MHGAYPYAFYKSLYRVQAQGSGEGHVQKFDLTAARLTVFRVLKPCRPARR
jgi:hypothetical protein